MVGWLYQVRIKNFLTGLSGGKNQVETILGLTHIACKLLFWKYIPIFLFIVWPICGLFALFGPAMLSFGVKIKFKNFLGIYSYRLSTLVLEV